jgi:hypothetical protein
MAVQRHEPEDKLFTIRTGVIFPFEYMKSVSPADIPSVV